MTSLGFSACNVSAPRPIFSSVPGRKLSTNIAAEGTSFASNSRASGRRSSRQRLFLLRA